MTCVSTTPEQSAYLRLAEHCATCATCKPVLDRMGRAVGAPAQCPEADALRRVWSVAHRAAGR